MRESAEGLLELCLAGRSAKLLLLANEWQLFPMLDAGDGSVEALAASLAVDPALLRTVLRALGTLGVVSEDADGRFRLAPWAQECLLPGGATFVGDNLRYQRMIDRSLDDLLDALRRGGPQHQLADLLGQLGGDFVDSYIRGVADIARRPAARVAEVLAAKPIRRFVDIGGGHGVFSAQLLERAPDAAGEILDLAKPLEITRELQASWVEASRLLLTEGNYHEASLARDPAPDLFLVSHVIHDESWEESVALVRRAAEALAPGGRVAIHDFAVRGTGSEPAFAAMFSVNLMLYSQGRVYHRDEYTAMLEQAGLVDVETHEILEGEVSNPSCLFVGYRPGR